MPLVGGFDAESYEAAREHHYFGKKEDGDKKLNVVARRLGQCGGLGEEFVHHLLGFFLGVDHGIAEVTFPQYRRLSTYADLGYTFCTPPLVRIP